VRGKRKDSVMFDLFHYNDRVTKFLGSLNLKVDYFSDKYKSSWCVGDVILEYNHEFKGCKYIGEINEDYVEVELIAYEGCKFMKVAIKEGEIIDIEEYYDKRWDNEIGINQDEYLV
jgi:IS4 transposase